MRLAPVVLLMLACARAVLAGDAGVAQARTAPMNRKLVGNMVGAQKHLCSRRKSIRQGPEISGPAPTAIDGRGDLTAGSGTL